MNKIKNSLSALSILSLLFCNVVSVHAEEMTTPSFTHAFTNVADNAIPAVVSIQIKTLAKTSARNQNFEFFGDDFFQQFFGGALQRPSEPEIGQASGFIVSPDGYIITNSHVVNKATEVEVILNDERSFSAKVIGQDPSTDVAVIKIDAKDLPYLKLANSDQIKVGQWVVAIGTPMGLQATLTTGVVSAKGRNNLDIARIEDFIQTDAAINRGNSGGPLLNLNHEVIGMNTAIVSNNGSGYMGIGFAIPSNIIKNDFDQILAHGSVSRGFIGVALQQVDSDLAQALGLEKPEGALVAEVTKGSPAEKAGIKQGDIILKYDDHPFSTIGVLRNAIALMNPGAKIDLLVLHHDKSTANVTVEIGNMPDAEEKQKSSVQQDNKLGIEVQELTPELASSLGYTGLKGVVVTKVQPNSAATWAGVKKGSLILSVNQKPVTSIDEFNKVIADMDSSKPVLLLLKQGEITRFISIRVK